MGGVGRKEQEEKENEGEGERNQKKKIWYRANEQTRDVFRNQYTQGVGGWEGGVRSTIIFITAINII